MILNLFSRKIECNLSCSQSTLQLTNLPNEILLLILKKLTKIEVLYSLIGVNLRLDQILKDPIFTGHLNLMKSSSNGHHINPLDDSILDLEPLSMDTYLLETDLDRIFKSQITTLIITFADHDRKTFPSDTLNVVCAHVLTKFNSLRRLEFYPYFDMYIDHAERLSFGSLELPNFSSSTLTTLHINVDLFDDCLHTFYVNVQFFPLPSSTIVNQEKLFDLKCFSLTCDLATMFYDESIVPLLYRMLNLEELFLSIVVFLRIFSHLPSNNDIQHTFKVLEDDYQIVSYIDHILDGRLGRCHIYSNIYTLNSLRRLTNNFPFVHVISLVDHRPFEHEFFIRIAQAFPFLQQLNQSRSNLSIIDYPHLTVLNVCISRYNYVEQFLDATKTRLRNSIRLITNYHDLQIVTNNFTRDATRINCAKVKYLDDFKRWNVPNHFYDYFPLLET